MIYMLNITRTLCLSFLIIIFVWGFVEYNNEQKLTDADYGLMSGDDHVWLYRISSGRVVLGEHIVDYKITGHYFIALRMVAESTDCDDEYQIPTIVTLRTNIKKYMIIDLNTQQESKELSEKEYYKMLSDLKLSDPSLAVPESYDSNESVFQSCKDLKVERSVHI
jgi:hypothetical protein